MFLNLTPRPNQGARCLSSRPAADEPTSQTILRQPKPDRRIQIISSWARSNHVRYTEASYHTQLVESAMVSFTSLEELLTCSFEDVHWRVISSDNMLSIYGDSEISYMQFRWYDADFPLVVSGNVNFKGNAVLYKYLKDNATRIDLSMMHQRNRGDTDNRRRQSNEHW